jgi:hypothetical protein
MSYVIAAPEMMTSAATDLATIGSDLSAAHTAAALPTAGLIPAAADEVSAGIAHLLSTYAGRFQTLAGKAAVFHEQFVHNLKSGASSYTSTEAASTSLLQPIINTIGSLLNKLEPGLGTIFEQSPINFALGLLYIPFELLGLLILLPFLPFILVLAAA